MRENSTFVLVFIEYNKTKNEWSFCFLLLFLLFFFVRSFVRCLNEHRIYYRIVNSLCASELLFVLRVLSKRANWIVCDVATAATEVVAAVVRISIFMEMQNGLATTTTKKINANYSKTRAFHLHKLVGNKKSELNWIMKSRVTNKERKKLWSRADTHEKKPI